MKRLVMIACGLLSLAAMSGTAQAEYAFKPAPEQEKAVYPKGHGRVQNNDPWGYSAMAVGEKGRSWIIAASSEAEAQRLAQAECKMFGDDCQTVVGGTDSGFFLGGYCDKAPKVTYSTIGFLDAQDRFYGYQVRSDTGLVEQHGNCEVIWLGHRVAPPLEYRPERTIVSSRGTTSLSAR